MSLNMQDKVTLSEHSLKKLESMPPAISAGIKDLNSSKILLVNTDTVPGLAVLPYLSEAVQDIYALKGRTYRKPLVWMADDFSRLASELVVEEYAVPLIKRYWPGALTLVFKVKPKTPTHDQLEYLEKTLYQDSEGTRSDHSYSLGVRIPQGDETLRLLLKALEAPLAVTSANRSGEEELTDLASIKAEFKEKISYTLFDTQYQEKAALTAGEFSQRQVSTVVDVSTPELKVIRKGAVVFKK